MSWSLMTMWSKKKDENILTELIWYTPPSPFPLYSPPFYPFIMNHTHHFIHFQRLMAGAVENAWNNFLRKTAANPVAPPPPLLPLRRSHSCQSLTVVSVSIDITEYSLNDIRFRSAVDLRSIAQGWKPDLTAQDSQADEWIGKAPRGWGDGVARQFRAFSMQVPAQNHRDGSSTVPSRPSAIPVALTSPTSTPHSSTSNSRVSPSKLGGGVLAVLQPPPEQTENVLAPVSAKSSGNNTNHSSNEQKTEFSGIPPPPPEEGKHDSLVGGGRSLRKRSVSAADFMFEKVQSE